jgi:hypothetical protein
MTSDLTERAGVEHVRAKFVGERGWYPREPERPDYGIDVYVECADDGRPNGRLLGVQVKSGSSYFDEATDEGLVFRGEARHLHYWTHLQDVHKSVVRLRDAPRVLPGLGRRSLAIATGLANPHEQAACMVSGEHGLRRSTDA